MILVVVGAVNTEKANLASYQLKDVAQNWCKIWKDNQAFGQSSSHLGDV